MQKITEYDPAFFKEKFRYDLKKKYDNTSPLQSFCWNELLVEYLKFEKIYDYGRQMEKVQFACGHNLNFQSVNFACTIQQSQFSVGEFRLDDATILIFNRRILPGRYNNLNFQSVNFAWTIQQFQFSVGEIRLDDRTISIFSRWISPGR